MLDHLMQNVIKGIQMAKCYQCKHRGTVPGSAHSCCRYPGNKTELFDMFDDENRINAGKLNVQAERHGILSGWFYWPIDFDPIWLVNCDGFEAIINKENLTNDHKIT